MKLTLPKEYELAYKPDEVAIESSIGSVRRIVELEDQCLTLTTTLVIEGAEVIPEDWPDLRAMINSLEGDRAQTILLRRKD